ncbi:MAG: cystathionine beta-lyase [Flammeovirgaceae bacterium]|jgi:cystathionine gamma-lyase
MKFGTKVIHAGVEPDPSTGAIMTPIYQTSTFAQATFGAHQTYEYARTHNPTRDALQKSLASLENGKHGFCFSSGMGATDTVMKLLNPGDEVIVTNDLYGGSYRIFTKVFAKYGIKFHFIPMDSTDGIDEYINENTKMIWVETPTNPLMNIIDIEAFAKVAKESNLILTVDNTFATPYLQNPLDLGADIVLHSVTKYLGGHSDTVMGALITNDDELAKEIAFIQNACGAIPGPQDCFLVLRGVKTLHIRMQRHCENAQAIVKALQANSKVEKVNYPGLPENPTYEIAKRQMKDFGGMVSFTLKGNKKEAAVAILEKFKLFTLAESLGGVESLAGHPASMTHASIPKEEREKAGLKESLIRLSVGIEDIDDLLTDLKQAIG